MSDSEAIEELTEAIRFTAEYIGPRSLPAIEGWSWYDALVKYAPEKALAFHQRYVPLDSGDAVPPTETPSP